MAIMGEHPRVAHRAVGPAGALVIPSRLTPDMPAGLPIVVFSITDEMAVALAGGGVGGAHGERGVGGVRLTCLAYTGK